MNILIVDGNEKEASERYTKMGMDTQYEVYQKVLENFFEKKKDFHGNIANGAVYIFDYEFLDWLIQNHQKDPNAPKWMDDGKALVGGLIGGIAAMYHLLPYLGRGDKNYALRTYLDINLREDKPLGAKSLMSDIGGDLQSILFARRVVSSCNTLIKHGVIRKKDGSRLQVEIEETILTKAGLGDPSAKKD